MEFADDVILTFALDEDLEPVVTNSVPAPEGDIDETDALAEDLTDETEE